MWRFQDGIAMAAQVAVPLVIRDDQHDVRRALVLITPRRNRPEH